MLYPKIDTLFERDKLTFKVIPGEYKDEIYKLVKSWEWTEKIDGTNIRIMYADSSESRSYQFTDNEKNTSQVIFNLSSPKLSYGGKTDNAEIPKGVIKYLDEIMSIDKLTELFGEKPVTIYGEGYGPKIQSGGGYSSRQQFIAFDICVGETYWLKHSDVEEICGKIGLDVVPSFGTMDIYEAVEMIKAGFKSRLGDGSMDAEGLIGRPPIPLFDAKHRRLICKLKTCDFQKSVDTFFNIENPRYYEGDICKL